MDHLVTVYKAQEKSFQLFQPTVLKFGNRSEPEDGPDLRE